MKEYLVIGAGHQGFALAGHLALNGERVNIWNRTESHIYEIMRNHNIYCTGLVSGVACMNKVSTNIDEVMSDIIFVTTPSIAHNDIAELIANKVTDKNIIILSPGRTFGAITFEKNLINNGCKSIPHILETQTIIHTCRKTTTDSVHIFALKKDVLISSLNTEGISDLIKTFPLCISKYLKEANSIIETYLGNIGMILHLSLIHI